MSRDIIRWDDLPTEVNHNKIFGKRLEKISAAANNKDNENLLRKLIEDEDKELKKRLFNKPSVTIEDIHKEVRRSAEEVISKSNGSKGISVYKQHPNAFPPRKFPSNDFEIRKLYKTSSRTFHRLLFKYVKTDDRLEITENDMQPDIEQIAERWSQGDNSLQTPFDEEYPEKFDGIRIMHPPFHAAVVNDKIKDLKKSMKKLKNWSPPGIDGVQVFWYKKFTSVHRYLVEKIEEIFENPEKLPRFLRIGLTELVYVKKNGENINKYKPITYLPSIYKIISRYIFDKIFDHYHKNNILTDQQMGGRKGYGGIRIPVMVDGVFLKDQVSRDKSQEDIMKEEAENNERKAEKERLNRRITEIDQEIEQLALAYRFLIILMNEQDMEIILKKIEDIQRQKGICKKNLDDMKNYEIVPKDKFWSAQVDYEKAFDSVPHSLIIKLLRIHKVDQKIIKFLEYTLNHYETRIFWKATNGSVAKMELPRQLKRGLFFGDPLSTLLFWTLLNPLSYQLEKKESELGLTLKSRDKVFIVSHLFYLDDVKLYSSKKDNLKELINIVIKYNSNIGLKLSKNKSYIFSVPHTPFEKAWDDLQGTEYDEEWRKIKYMKMRKYLGFKQNPNIMGKNMKSMRWRVAWSVSLKLECAKQKIWNSNKQLEEKILQETEKNILKTVFNTVGVLDWAILFNVHVNDKKHKVYYKTSQIMKKYDGLGNIKLKKCYKNWNKKLRKLTKTNKLVRIAMEKDNNNNYP